MASAMTPAPRLVSLATAVPPHPFPQDRVADHVMQLFDRDRSEIRRMLPVFGNAGIEHRYSCMPGDWYFAQHGWVERAGLGLQDIDGIVSVSTTGITTPSLDALIIERLKLRTDVRRLPIFG